MHLDVAEAISALQRRALNESRAHEGEILEEALTDLVRNPHRSGDLDHLVGSSIARARKKLRRRATLAPIVGKVEGDPNPDESLRVRLAIVPAVSDDPAHELIALEDVLARAALSAIDRRYIRLLCAGLGSREIAELDGEPVARIKVRLSRARSRARQAWRAAA